MSAPVQSLGAESSTGSTLEAGGAGTAAPKEAPDVERNPRPQQFLNAFATTFPRIYSVASRLTKYIRGPDPRVELPGPTPLLNRSFQFRSISFTVSLEPLVLRWTRPFTALWIFGVIAVAYLVSLAFFARAHFYLTPADSFVNCLATYWLPKNECGIDGNLCGPFTESSFEFRCPAGCGAVTLANLRTVGTEEPVYVPLVVGGGDTNGTYRGDSWICAAAIHAGVISESRGGCAALSLIGSHTNFISKVSNGIASVAFPSVFPVSFTFQSSTTLTNCKDLRNYALAFNILVTVFLFLILRLKPILLYWSITCIGFWHIIFFSAPRDTPPSIADAFGTFLPALFVAYAFWRVGFRHVMPFFSNAPIERMVWYLPAFWCGCLFNIVTGKIPVDRLVAGDISGRPGALVSLIVICVVIFFLVLNQLRVIRKTGWLPVYIKWYIAGGLVLVVLSQMPGLYFRLHHYFAAMLIMPLTAFPSRLSAVYQAFCLGMFMQGVAAFGFDPIFESPDDVRRDAPLGSALPIFATNSTNYNATIPLANQSISWLPVPDNGEGWNGFSLLIDDVERYSGTALNFTLQALEAGIPHFFRLALQRDGASGDYTKAAVLWPNGTFTDPKPGPS